MRSVKTFPPIDGIIVDAEGYLWVSEYSESETWLVDRWSIFSPEGRWLGVLDMPGDEYAAAFFRCRGYVVTCWIDGDFFVVLGREQFDVERVEAYRIRRGG